ncbi:MAG: transcriptional repressor [Gammaproteobacteria bacterium]|nr:transcriptional repressor [Gammaproteobacteria bacterium]
MKEIVRVLTHLGISPTPQRVEIAAAMLYKPQHLSAEQVLHMVNQTSNVVSKATVYNTLGLFARKGLVREVIVDPNKVFYDSNTDHHHHFYNVVTGELIDVEATHLDIAKLPQSPHGTACEGIDVIIRVRPVENAAPAKTD